jgi:uncharacterized repeat protein (TIGR01451 family)
MTATNRLRLSRRRARLVGSGVGLWLAAAPAWLLTGAGSPVAFASSAGDDNRGDVWVDNTGQPSGPGHEMDPHLQCRDINLWGNGLADSRGVYTVDGWPPSGAMEQDYPTSGSGHWSYNTARGGSQVIDVIRVKTLVEDALRNGDTPQPQQGLHFKLQLSQDPQKHKTFWVDCPAPQRPSPTPTPTPTPSPTPQPAPALVLSKSVTPSGEVQPGTLLTYTITLRNTGQAAATQVRIDDAMSGTAAFTVNDHSGSTSDSFTGTPMVTVTRDGTGHYHWTYATVAAGAVDSVTYTAVIDTPGTVSAGVTSFTLDNTASAGGTNCAAPGAAACTTANSVRAVASGVQAAGTTTPSTGAWQGLRLAIPTLLLLGGVGLMLAGLLVQPAPRRAR